MHTGYPPRYNCTVPVSTPVIYDIIYILLVIWPWRDK